MGCSSSKHKEHDVAFESGQPRPVQISAEYNVNSRISQRSQNRDGPRQYALPTHTGQLGQAIDDRHARQLNPPSQQMVVPNPYAMTRSLRVQDVWPKRVSLGDSGVVVQIWHHTNHSNTTTGPITGWVYLSDGLQKINQPEVIFRLRQRPIEHPSSFPTFPLEWIQVVYEFVQNGIHLDEGQMCQVIPGDCMRFVLGKKEVVRDSEAWKGNTSLRMFVHTPPPGWDGVYDTPLGFKIPRAAHHVVGLTAEEAAVALEFGPTRVISHLGLSVRCFPSPAWVERDRRDCCTMADQANSGRSKFKLARIFGINALLIGGFESGTVVLSLPTGERKQKAIQAAFKDLSKELMFGFDSFMSEQADSGLTWKSGQTEAQAYGKGTSTNFVNLAFIGFINYAEENKDHCTMIDDGYCVFLRPNSWTKLLQAVALNEDCIIPLGGLSFHLKWVRPVYKSPFNNRPVLERFRVNDPIVPPLTRSHVEHSGVTFLHEPSPTIISSMALCEYLERIRQLLYDLIPPTPPPGIQQPCETFSVRLQLPTLPGGALATKCEPSSAGLDIELLSNAIMLVPLEFKDTPPENELVYLCQVDFRLWSNE